MPESMGILFDLESSFLARVFIHNNAEADIIVFFFFSKEISVYKNGDVCYINLLACDKKSLNDFHRCLRVFICSYLFRKARDSMPEDKCIL